jgi:hypothetical protein
LLHCKRLSHIAKIKALKLTVYLKHSSSKVVYGKRQNRAYFRY